MINGPDSISDPFARRLRCIESYPSVWRLGSAPKTARLNSARLSSTRGWWRGRWVPLLLTCQMAGRWHGMPPMHAGVMLTSWWRHPYPGLGLGSGRLVFGSGQPFRAKKTRGMRGVRLCAWPATLPARDGACVRFRHLISTRFSTVASSLPPLHSGMVKTQFGQLSFLSKNQTPL
jgi:hypothetical protein